MSCVYPFVLTSYHKYPLLQMTECLHQWIQTWLQHGRRSLVFLDLSVQWQQWWGLLQVHKDGESAFSLSTNELNNEDLLCVPHLFVCASTLFTCANYYVTYIITIQLYFGWLNGCFEHCMSNLAYLRVQDTEKQRQHEVMTQTPEMTATGGACRAPKWWRMAAKRALEWIGMFEIPAGF